MTLNTVTITGDATPYEVYGGLTAATHYLLAGISDGAISWRGLLPDDQARMLIAATRYIDRLSWQGVATTPAVGGTVLQWPRTGVTTADGTTISSSTVPQDILNAVFELAGLLAGDSESEGYRDDSAALAGIRAGGVAINYSMPLTSLANDGPQIPPIVLMLIGQYMATSNVKSARATGTDGVSSFDTDDSNGSDVNPFARSWPL
jgi:hypothetical protein